MHELIINCRTRLDLYRAFDTLGYKTGIEIGILRGLNSEEILLNSKIKLYSIDHWNNHDKSDLSNIEDYIHTVARLFRFRDKSVVINDEGEAASQLFQDSSVDFIYIDAGLTPDSYYNMIRAWWPKVKCGGIMCGHLFELINDGVTIQPTNVVNEALDRFKTDLGLGDNCTKPHLHIVLNRDIPANADIDSYVGSKTWIIDKPISCDQRNDIKRYCNKHCNKNIKNDANK